MPNIILATQTILKDTLHARLSTFWPSIKLQELLGSEKYKKKSLFTESK